MTGDPLSDARRLSALAQTGMLAKSDNEAMDNIAALAARLLGAPASVVSLITPDRQLCVGQIGMAPNGERLASVPISHSFCALVVQSEAPLIVADARHDDRVRLSPAVTEMNVIAYAGIPLRLPTGEVLGALGVLDHVPRTWTNEQVDGLARLARTAVTELELRTKVSLLSDTVLAQTAAEQDLRRVFSTTPLPTWIYDPATLEVLDVNPAACTHYGYTRDEFLALSVRDLRPAEEQDQFDEAVAAILADPGDTRAGRYVHVRRDGQRMRVETSSSPVAFRERQARLVVSRDLTEISRNEQELVLLRTAVSRLNDIVLITEAEPIHGAGPRVVFVNEAFERRTGYSAAEVIGRTPRILQGPKTDRATLDVIGAALHAWEPVRAELINYTKSGAEFWLELDIVPVANSEGWYTHWVAVERDITERKQLEAELRQSQRLEALGQFSGGIAHDFANITAIIAASAELLSARLDESGERDADLQAIRSAADRARSLVSQILAFSRRQVLDVRPISLQGLVRQTETLLRRLVDEHVTLDVQLPTEELSVLADETQIVQVLLNLAANARDAMPGGGRLSVEVLRATTPEGDFGRLRVRDTGTGIAPEHLEVIFEPFFTTKAPGRGTGLGLATVYGIVRQLGGELRVESTVGEGTVFEIDLPCAAPRSAAVDTAAAAAEPTSDIAAREALLKGLRVLLVEDEDALRRATQRLLQRFGVTVDAAVNGVEALQLLRDMRQKPDLVLTDLIMPGLGGRALAEALRELHPDMPVLFMSGYDAGTAKTAVGELIAAGHLQKPFEMATLLDAVAAAASPPGTSRTAAA